MRVAIIIAFNVKVILDPTYKRGGVDRSVCAMI